MLFTVCDKKTGAALSRAPLLYTFDPDVNKVRQPILFESLPGGISYSHMSAKEIELETALRGQNSALQPFCRVQQREDRTVALPHPTALDQELKQQYAMMSQVTSTVTQTPTSALGRNMKPAIFSPIPMSLER